MFAWHALVEVAGHHVVEPEKLDIRVDRPVTVSVDLPKSFVQKRNLRIDRQIKPGHRLEPDVVEYIGEKFFGSGEWIGPGNAGRRGRNDLRYRVIEVHVKIAIDGEPVDGRGVPSGLEPVPHAETQNRPTIERIDRIELGKIDRLQSRTWNVLVKLQKIGGRNCRLGHPGEVCVRLDDVAQSI